jgi:phytoene dehydrogenase-like protein
VTIRNGLPASADVVIIGGGHNGLVAALLLARRGLSVVVLEEKETVGGAAKTERPFARAKGLSVSSGAYLLGLAPPELLREIDVDLPLRRRDPHYFLPTTDQRYLLFGSNTAEMKRQFFEFFSEADWNAHTALQAELGALRDDIASSWLAEPLSIEETAERYVRPALRAVFVELCRGTIRAYLDRFGFKSDLIKAMYAVTDAFAGVTGGFDSNGTAMNFLAHNMCRLPGSGGTWMIVEGGMGEVTRRIAAKAESHGAIIKTGRKVAQIEASGGVTSGVLLADGARVAAKVVISNADPYRTRALAGEDALAEGLSERLDAMARDGSTLKVNLAMSSLPRFTCLPEDKGQFGPTIHLLPDESVVMDSIIQAHRDASMGLLPEFPAIEWYFHTPIDPSLKDAEGHHNSALFVQWVPYTLADGKRWEDEEPRYVKHLLSICDRFAPGTSDRVLDTFTLSPPGIERHFGITRGHIHHVDNSFGFKDRVPYRLGRAGLYSCSAGTHPAGAVIGAAGHNAARAVLADLGK